MYCQTRKHKESELTATIDSDPGASVVPLSSCFSQADGCVSSLSSKELVVVVPAEAS